MAIWHQWFLGEAGPSKEVKCEFSQNKRGFPERKGGESWFRERSQSTETQGLETFSTAGLAHRVRGKARVKAGPSGEGGRGRAGEGSSALGFHSGEGSVSAWYTDAKCSEGAFLNLVLDICSLQLTSIW